MTGLLDWTAGTPGLAVQRCAACGHHWYFARPFCPRCGAADPEATQASAQGTVYAITRVDRAPSPEWRDRAPYGIALIDLDEGVRAMTQADPALRIGDRVRIVFHEGPAGLIPFAEAAQ